MNKKVSNNATDSIKGIIHQFYIALDKCFELVEGESVFIEYYGDVSINNKVQIETKKYKGNLTDLDHNFWKTLKNWMNDSFPHDKFKFLILSTTQNVTNRTIFCDWNSSDSKAKLKKLLDIQVKYHNTKKKDNETVDLIESSMSKQKREKLKTILSKVSIQYSQKQDTQLYKEIKEKHSKNIPKSSKDELLVLHL